MNVLVLGGFVYDEPRTVTQRDADWVFFKLATPLPGAYQRIQNGEPMHGREWYRIYNVAVPPHLAPSFWRDHRGIGSYVIAFGYVDYMTIPGFGPKATLVVNALENTQALNEFGAARFKKEKKEQSEK